MNIKKKNIFNIIVSSIVILTFLATIVTITLAITNWYHAQTEHEIELKTDFQPIINVEHKQSCGKKLVPVNYPINKRTETHCKNNQFKVEIDTERIPENSYLKINVNHSLIDSNHSKSTEVNSVLKSIMKSSKQPAVTQEELNTFANESIISAVRLLNERAYCTWLDSDTQKIDIPEGGRFDIVIDTELIDYLPKGTHPKLKVIADCEIVDAYGKSITGSKGSIQTVREQNLQQQANQ